MTLKKTLLIFSLITLMTLLFYGNTVLSQRGSGGTIGEKLPIGGDAPEEEPAPGEDERTSPTGPSGRPHPVRRNRPTREGFRNPG